MPFPPEKLKVLVVGSGGREHALAWALSKSPVVTTIYVYPGNGGTINTIPKVHAVDFDREDDDPMENLPGWCQRERINLVVIGPEVPLVEGFASNFRERGIRVFGPSRAAARMEGDKGFAKDFMRRHNIPTAAYKRFTDHVPARRYLEEASHRVVIKASGLAAGKGVIIPETDEQAQQAIDDIMVDMKFDSAGDEVVIEEFLEGDELSILTFCDGREFKSLPPAQDHKRIFDGDKGPNTGGMGCYAPTRIVSEATLKQIDEQVLKPTLDGMRKEGFPFVGLLFTGLMMTKTGPKVLEYNVRFGDPETQTLLPLLESDLGLIMSACTRGCLDMVEVKIRPEFSATVVMAAGGYPDSYKKGTPIQIGAVEPGTTIFHAGTAIKGGQLVTAGGRVIAVNAVGSSLEEAVEKAYKGVHQVSFNGMHYREDIAHRAFRKNAGAATQGLTYESAGVSVEESNRFVELIKPMIAQTKRPGSEAKIGGFGSSFSLAEAGYGPDAPRIVLATDGVGTKLKVAMAVGKFDTVGIDLVAMNVNDLLVQGAEPLSFVDYFSCSTLDKHLAVSFVSGVVEGCKQAGCSLDGGETAEMPGMYRGKEFDVAGTAMGAIRSDKPALPRTSEMLVGDILIGLASSGVHSNGFSLVRKIVEAKVLQYADPAPWDRGTSVGEALLTPTRIYAKVLKPLIDQDLLKGMAHITGGGLIDNVPRMLPSNLAAHLDSSKWPVPPVLQWLKGAGSLDDREFARTFNTGLGMVLVVAGENIAAVERELSALGEKAFAVGVLVARGEGGEQCVVR